MSSSINKRIAKNTLMLYFRMLLTMGVSLFTVRVVLSTLGEVDYGIYNVIGGIVAMLAFLSSTMASASQRFFSYELGLNNFDKLKKTFSMTMTIYAMIAAIVFIVAETVGLWFINNKLNIPTERMYAARWVYQFSILSVMMTMFMIPYNAVIIAHENMKVYAWVSIIQVVLNLLIVYFLLIFSFDKLILYAILMFMVNSSVILIYMLYTTKRFQECRYSFYWDTKLFKTLVSYAGWNLFGAAAGPIMGQGVNILLNIFFGPVVNAARGIAYQIMGAVNQFATNFQMAMNPQIIKSFATNDLKYMHQLTFRGAKYSFFLLLTLSLPVILETKYILAIWLKNIPDHTVIFTRLSLINILIDSISLPLKTAAQASGRIRKYQIVIGSLLIINLPVSYVFLKLNFAPEITFYISICISVIALIARLFILKHLVRIKIIDFIKQVLLKISVVVVIVALLPIYMHNVINNELIKIFLVVITTIITAIIAIYFVGLEMSEKTFIRNKIAKFFK